jgi:ATP-dependent Clp protease ATP-binding subunit ClpC
MTVPPDSPDSSSEETASLTLSPGVRRILQLADARRQAAGQDTLGLHHLLVTLLENYAPMARDLVPELDADALRDETRGKIEAGDAGEPVEVDALLARAAERARARGKTTVAERDVAAVTLFAAGYVTALATNEEIIPAFVAPPGENALPLGGGGNGGGVTPGVRRFPALERYGQDLTEAAKVGKLAPFVGREGEVQMVIETLCRRITRNPVLVGPAGVGKTAIVEGLAYRIASGNVPAPLAGARLFAVLPSALTSGASHYGELEKRMESLLEEARDPSVLLFIDEVHAIVGAGGRPGSNDLATLLKPALARGEVACLAATTDDEYRRFIEQDPALERRFQPIRVNELGPEATLDILKELRTVSATARGVNVSDAALRYLIDLGARFLRNRHFPAKAVDLFEQCVAFAISRGQAEVSAGDADAVVRRLVGMPTLPQERVHSLRQHLADAPAASAALGEEDREALLNRLQVSLEGFDLRPERPNATVLLVGRAAGMGAGLAREIAEGLFGSPERTVTINFGRFTETHHLSMLLGSPPGYVGYSERLPLHELEQTPWCVVLCENVDDCHPSFREVLAQALEVGHFTDATGKHLYLSDAVVVATARGVGDGGASSSAFRRSGFLEVARRRGGADEAPPANGDGDALSLRAEAERLLGAELADHCDFICAGADEANAIGGAEARRKVEQGLLRPIASRYAQEGLVLRWDPAVVDFLMNREPGQTSPRDRERILDRHISPLLLPFRGKPGAERGGRELLLSLREGILTVAEVPSPDGGDNNGGENDGDGRAS